MDDYISRQAAITEVCDAACVELKDTCTHPKDCGFWMGLMNLPTEDVAPVAHGYWIPQKANHEFEEAWMKCSACGYPVSMWTGNTNFCPNCGADMRDKQDD